MTVTAFVLTTGSPTFTACLEAVRTQCHVEVIRDVAPMAAAKQRMVELCRTDHLVLVAEDMVLYPHALARLVAAISDAPPDVVCAVAPLWDVDTEQPIYGLKIFRRKPLRRVPFVSHPDGDRHDRMRWTDAGLRVLKRPLERKECLGDHVVATPEEAFTRWRRLWHRHRRTGAQQWIEAWLPKLAERYRVSGSRRDLLALAGALIGSTEEVPDVDTYDIRRTDPVLARLTL